MLFIQTCISSVQLCSCLCLDAHDCPSSLQHIIPLGLNYTTFHVLQFPVETVSKILVTHLGIRTVQAKKNKKWGEKKKSVASCRTQRMNYLQIVSWQVHNHATVTCLTSHYCHAVQSTVNSTRTCLLREKTRTHRLGSKIVS